MVRKYDIMIRDEIIVEEENNNQIAPSFVSEGGGENEYH